MLTEIEDEASVQFIQNLPSRQESFEHSPYGTPNKGGQQNGSPAPGATQFGAAVHVVRMTAKYKVGTQRNSRACVVS